MKTVAFHTLGCKVNTYETEAVWNLFRNEKYERVDFKSIADVYIINTCTVTNTGDSKSRKVIRQAIRRNPDAIIVVMGCYSQISPKEVMDIEGVDIVVGTQGRDKLIHFIKKYQEERIPINSVTNIMKQDKFESLGVFEFRENTRAFLKIQEGCNNFCTFCIIPWARGLIRSRGYNDVINQANQLVNNGYKEIVLTGIHTAGYGEDLENYNFADLLRDLSNKVSGLERLRISSIEASQITDEILKVLQESNIIANHLHIPLQSGSDTVLKRMKRNYTTKEYHEKINEIREIFPDIAITTDVIVGFPGESDVEFMETFNFIKEIGYSELHVFPYSKRNGTPAAKMDNQIPDIVKTGRVAELISLNEKLAKEYANHFENKPLKVIPETIHDNMLVGHTSNYLKVVFEGNDDLIGEIVNVKITKTDYPENTGDLL